MLQSVCKINFNGQHHFPGYNSPMPDQRPPLDYGIQPPKARRWRRSIIFDVVNGVLFAYIVALALIGFIYVANCFVHIRNGH